MDNTTKRQSWGFLWGFAKSFCVFNMLDRLWQGRHTFEVGLICTQSKDRGMKSSAKRKHQMDVFMTKNKRYNIFANQQIASREHFCTLQSARMCFPIRVYRAGHSWNGYPVFYPSTLYSIFLRKARYSRRRTATSGVAGLAGEDAYTATYEQS